MPGEGQGRPVGELTPARLRGLWPERGSITRMAPQLDVTICLSADLYRSMKAITGRNSFVFCIEEAVHTAFRAMSGQLTLDTLLSVVASVRDVSNAEAMYGRLEEGEEAAANILLMAAHAVTGADLSDLPKSLRSKVMAAIEAAGTGDACEDAPSQGDLFTYADNDVD